jgi:hypothetical protein
MIWWIVLAVVAVLVIGMLMRRRKSDREKRPVDQRDVDRLRRDSQARGFGSM